MKLNKEIFKHPRFIKKLEALKAISPEGFKYILGMPETQLNCLDGGDLSDWFSWSDTEQGHKYWAKLYTKLGY